jgi:hypothetical protein
LHKSTKTGISDRRSPSIGKGELIQQPDTIREIRGARFGMMVFGAIYQKPQFARMILPATVLPRLRWTQLLQQRSAGLKVQNPHPVLMPFSVIILILAKLMSNNRAAYSSHERF